MRSSWYYFKQNFVISKNGWFSLQYISSIFEVLTIMKLVQFEIENFYTINSKFDVITKH